MYYSTPITCGVDSDYLVGLAQTSTNKTRFLQEESRLAKGEFLPGEGMPAAVAKREELRRLLQSHGLQAPKKGGDPG